MFKKNFQRATLFIVLVVGYLVRDAENLATPHIRDINFDAVRTARRRGCAKHPG